MKSLSENMFDVHQDTQVPEGTAVVMTKAGKPVYKGPIGRAKPTPGCVMVLNPLDYDVLHEIVMRKRGKYH